ncbi:putative serine protease K12H4.7 isoform X2 [Pectinophora gossypiella]|nr:putative serine protease K12H4.7 isoform X2 [Pectinophora gossypiella]
MRYHYNGVYAGGNEPPIIILVGGEWAISPQWVAGGFPENLASTIGGGLFYTEHRYYGETSPSNDTSVSELRFLTVDQALADLAQFIQIIKGDELYDGQYKNSKVVLLGCGYAGTMATWMRLAYPHLVYAAFSDSGPLQAQEEFPEYLEVVTTALRGQGGEQCVTAIEDAIAVLEALLDTNSGVAAIQQMFNTCAAIQASSPLDRATFYWAITEAFASLVQYATPGDIAAACDVLTDESEPNEVQRLANWITSQSEDSCLETRYSTMVEQNTNVSYDAPQAATRLRTYQACVEFGWYQTTNSSRQPFHDVIPVEFFHQICRDFFSTYFDETVLRAGIERTNLFFGGLGFLPDRVVSVAGGHDPWSPLGPNTNHATPLAPVYVVPEASHCQALRRIGESENAELERVKNEVMNWLSMWATGYPIFASAAGGLVACTLLLLAGVAAAL